MPLIQNIAWLGNGGEETHALQFQRKTSCNFWIFSKQGQGPLSRLQGTKNFHIFQGIRWNYLQLHYHLPEGTFLG